jgi:putative ABC transport system permease protein
MIARIALAVRLARRELRRGLSGFRIFLACLVLGVASIATVGSLSAALLEGLSVEGQRLLGGDVELRLVQREMTDSELQWLRRQGKVSMVAETRAMAVTPDGRARSNIELKAVDRFYPLYGVADVSPREPLKELFANREGVFGAAVEPRLLRKLGLKLGDTVRIGNARFMLRAVISQEPDRVAGGFSTGPRVLVSEFALRATGLVQPGSLINFGYRVALPPEITSREGVANFVSYVKDTYPAADWQVRDRWNAALGVRRFIEQVGAFLVLVGLTALVVGGVGVASAVKAYLDRRRDDIATLKCIGASGRFIFFMFLGEVMALAVVGVGIGLLIGAILPIVVGWLLAGLLPFHAQFGLFLGPLVSAMAFGLLTALAFAIWPLARAKEISPAVMFRDLIVPSRQWPHWPYVLATALALGSLVVLAVALTPNMELAAGFAVGALLVFGALRGTGWVLMWLARSVPRPRAMMARLALSNIYRPGAPTPAIVLSLGLGLTLLASIALIDANIRRVISEETPTEAPSFFFVGIQTAQADRFRRLIEDTPGAEELALVPMLRGRITRIKGVPVEKAEVAREARWALNGDRGLTYGDPPGSQDQLVKGRWWPKNYKGPPLMSFSADLAAGMGIDVGDTITVNILGREFTFRIANTRRVDFSSARMNFLMIVSPGVLEKAPHEFLATVHASRDVEDEIERAVSDTFASVSVIRVREALEAASELVRQLSGGVRAASFVTLLTGLLVLAGALAAGHRHRLFDAVVLKVMGATKAQVMATYLLEFAVLGLGAGLVAALCGTLAAGAVAIFVMQTSFVPALSTLAVVVIGGALAAMGLGIASTWTALSTPAVRTLRTV